MLVRPIDMPLDDLSVFGIDTDHGFLPADDPLRVLPSPYAAWEDVAHDLPKLIVSGSLRRTIEGLPHLTASALTDPQSMRRAMMLLSYLGHGYVWCAQDAADRIPRNIAVPWYQVAGQLGRPRYRGCGGHRMCFGSLYVGRRNHEADRQRDSYQYHHGHT